MRKTVRSASENGRISDCQGAMLYVQLTNLRIVRDTRIIDPPVSRIHVNRTGFHRTHPPYSLPQMPGDGEFTVFAITSSKWLNHLTFVEGAAAMRCTLSSRLCQAVFANLLATGNTTAADILISAQGARRNAISQKRTARATILNWSRRQG